MSDPTPTQAPPPFTAAPPTPAPATSSAGGAGFSLDAVLANIRVSDVVKDTLGLLLLIFGLALPWTFRGGANSDVARNGADHVVVWIITILSIFALIATMAGRIFRVLMAGKSDGVKPATLALGITGVRALSLLPYGLVATFIVVSDLLKWDDAISTGGVGIGLGLGLAGATLIGLPGKSELPLLPATVVKALPFIGLAVIGLWAVLLLVGPLATLLNLMSGDLNDLFSESKGGTRFTMITGEFGRLLSGVMIAGLIGLGAFKRSAAASLAARIAGVTVGLGVVWSAVRDWDYGPWQGTGSAYRFGYTTVAIVVLGAVVAMTSTAPPTSTEPGTVRFGAVRALLLVNGAVGFILASNAMTELFASDSDYLYSGASHKGWTVARMLVGGLIALISLAAWFLSRKQGKFGRIGVIGASAITVVLGGFVLLANSKRIDGDQFLYELSLRPATFAMYIYIPLVSIVLVLLPAKLALTVEGLRGFVSGRPKAPASAPAPAPYGAPAPVAPPALDTPPVPDWSSTPPPVAKATTPPPMAAPVVPPPVAAPPVAPPPVTPPPVAAPHPRAAEAADPATSASALYDIAVNIPELRATVAANPSAYPDLLEWLGKLGDPAVNAAIAAR